jgi:hypothetical protein
MLDLTFCKQMASLPFAILSLPDNQPAFSARGCCNLVFPPQSVAEQGLAVIKQFMHTHYGPPKLLMLILIARRRCVRHLPDEIWQMTLDEFITDPLERFIKKICWTRFGR